MRTEENDSWFVRWISTPKDWALGGKCTSSWIQVVSSLCAIV